MNDFVQESEAFHTLVVGLELDVEIGEICNGSKHDSNKLISTMVEIHIAGRGLHKVFGHKRGQYIIQETLVMSL